MYYIYIKIQRKDDVEADKVPLNSNVENKTETANVFFVTDGLNASFGSSSKASDIFLVNVICCNT